MLTPFLFPRKARVTYAGSTLPWRIEQRRVTERGIVGDVVEYAVVPDLPGRTSLGWCSEADLAPYEEPQP